MLHAHQLAFFIQVIKFQLGLYFFNFRLRGDEGSPEPIEYVKFIHRFLCKICEESGLKGLQYRGGPMETCGQCKEENVVFPYVEFRDGKGEVRDRAPCATCSTSYSMNALLVSDNPSAHSLA
jgi:hypothetical protein